MFQFVIPSHFYIVNLEFVVLY